MNLDPLELEKKILIIDNSDENNYMDLISILLSEFNYNELIFGKK